MFKRILVPTDGSEAAVVAMRFAIALARKHHATLLGLHVVDIKRLEGPLLRDLAASLGTAPYVNYQGSIAMILDERGQAALTVLQEACESAGVSCETSLVTGIVPRAIVENSELADLIVMGRGGEHAQWLEGLVGATTEAVIRRATRPVLVTGTETPGSSRFLVAYDGSRHAREALRAAVAIAAAWHMPFHLLVVGDDQARSVLDEARKYVQTHEVDVQYELRQGDPGETILNYAREIQADLMVMGAYGHSKVREMVVGSTTTTVINHSPCPVLLTR
jgi:nucleotide-binding universal stress UspA family protein